MYGCSDEACVICGDINPGVTPVAPFGWICLDCLNKISASQAHKIVLSIYKDIYEGFPLFTLEGTFFHLDQGLLAPAYAFATVFDRVQLDFDEVLEMALDGHEVTVQAEELDALSDFIQWWNRQQEDGTYYPNTNVLVIASWQGYDKDIAPLEFQLASGMFFYFWKGI